MIVGLTIVIIIILTVKTSSFADDSGTYILQQTPNELGSKIIIDPGNSQQVIGFLSPDQNKNCQEPKWGCCITINSPIRWTTGQNVLVPYFKIPKCFNSNLTDQKEVKNATFTWNSDNYWYYNTHIKAYWFTYDAKIKVWFTPGGIDGFYDMNLRVETSLKSLSKIVRNCATKQ